MGCHALLPGDLSDPGIEHASLEVSCVGKWVLYHQRHLSHLGPGLRNRHFITRKNKHPKVYQVTTADLSPSPHNVHSFILFLSLPWKSTQSKTEHIKTVTTSAHRFTREEVAQTSLWIRLWLLFFEANTSKNYRF